MHRCRTRVEEELALKSVAEHSGVAWIKIFFRKKSCIIFTKTETVVSNRNILSRTSLKQKN